MGAVTVGYQDFADRWNLILDVFDETGVRERTSVREVDAVCVRQPAEVGWTADRHADNTCWPRDVTVVGPTP